MNTISSTSAEGSSQSSSSSSSPNQERRMTKSEEIARNRMAIVSVLNTLNSLKAAEKTEEEELAERCVKCQIDFLKQKRLEEYLVAQRNKNRGLPQPKPIGKSFLPAWAEAYKAGDELKAAELLHESFFPQKAATAKKIKLDSGN